MSEIEKALAELKNLMAYREKELGFREEFRGLGLTSRKNLCLHPAVKDKPAQGIFPADHLIVPGCAQWRQPYHLQREPLL